MIVSIASVLEKVRRLRALATSANIHEAANAAAQADRLIQEHRLEESQIEATSGEPAEKPSESPDPITFGRRVQGWRWRLAVRLCSHYDVASYSSWRQGERTLHMVGRKSDVETVRYQVAYYTIEIERLAQSQKPGSWNGGRSFFNAFRLGAVVGLLEAMATEKRETIEASRAPAATHRAAMVLVNRRDESRAELEKHHPKLRRGGPSHGSTSDAAGFNAGKRAGAALNKNGKRIEGGSTRLLSGGESK